jgi:hypothetical protein
MDSPYVETDDLRREVASTEVMAAAAIRLIESLRADNFKLEQENRALRELLAKRPTVPLKWDGKGVPF